MKSWTPSLATLLLIGALGPALAQPAPAATGDHGSHHGHLNGSEIKERQEARYLGFLGCCGL